MELEDNSRHVHVHVHVSVHLYAFVHIVDLPLRQNKASMVLNLEWVWPHVQVRMRSVHVEKSNRNPGVHGYAKRFWTAVKIILAIHSIHKYRDTKYSYVYMRYLQNHAIFLLSYCKCNFPPSSKVQTTFSRSRLGRENMSAF